MDHETAGDPVRGLRWTRRTTAKVAAELCKLGTDICARTVARLLKKMGFSLRVNHKKRAGASHPNRDDQFHHIAEVRERCAVDNTPVISVDTKKKELVGAFRNTGAKWDHSPELVNDHDFRSDAEGRAIPYGIYDTRANAGTVFVGQTADTPAFAVDCIEKWWRTEGCKHYPEANALQILADGWKWQVEKGPLWPPEKGPPGDAYRRGSQSRLRTGSAPCERLGQSVNWLLPPSLKRCFSSVGPRGQ